ncbi:hypothetical protein Tco_0832425 [Tanacetum coccineum]
MDGDVKIPAWFPVMLEFGDIDMDSLLNISTIHISVGVKVTARINILPLASLSRLSSDAVTKILTPSLAHFDAVTGNCDAVSTFCDKRAMLEFILRDFAKNQIWDKVKETLSTRLNEYGHYICCENTTHMMNALKEARMESRERLLFIHYSLKMLLDIISKMNRKLEDEKIKMNDKGKGKVNDF